MAQQTIQEPVMRTDPKVPHFQTETSVPPPSSAIWKGRGSKGRKRNNPGTGTKASTSTSTTSTTSSTSTSTTSSTAPSAATTSKKQQQLHRARSPPTSSTSTFVIPIGKQQATSSATSSSSSTSSSTSRSTAAATPLKEDVGTSAHCQKILSKFEHGHNYGTITPSDEQHGQALTKNQRRRIRQKEKRRQKRKELNQPSIPENIIVVTSTIPAPAPAPEVLASYPVTKRHHPDITVALGVALETPQVYTSSRSAPSRASRVGAGMGIRNILGRTDEEVSASSGGRAGGAGVQASKRSGIPRPPPPPAALPWAARMLPAPFAQAVLVAKKRIRDRPEGQPWLLRVGPRPPLSTLRKTGIRSYESSRAPWLSHALPAAFAHAVMIAKRRARFQPQGLPWLLRAGPARSISALRHVDKEPSSRFKRGEAPKEPLPWMKRVLPAPIARAAMIAKKRSKFQPQGLPWLLRVGPARPISSLKHVETVPAKGQRAPWLSSTLPAAFAQTAMIGKFRTKQPHYGLKHVESPHSTRGSRGPWISGVLPAPFAHAAMAARSRSYIKPRGLPWLLRVGQAPPLSSLRHVGPPPKKSARAPWLSRALPAPIAQTVAIVKRRNRFQPQGLPWLLRVLRAGPAPSISTLRHISQEPSSAFKKGLSPKEPLPWLKRVPPAPIAHAAMIGKKRTRFQPQGLPWLLRVGAARPVSSLRHVEHVPKRGVWAPWLSHALRAPFAQAAAVARRRIKFQPRGIPWLLRIGPAPSYPSLRHVTQAPSSRFKRGEAPKEPLPWMKRVLPAPLAHAAMIAKKRSRFQPQGLPWLLRVGPAPAISTLKHVERVPRRGVRAPWLSHALPAAFAQAALIGKKRMKNPGYGLRHVATYKTGSRSPWIATTTPAPFAQAAAIARRRMRFQPQGKPWLLRVGRAPAISTLRHVSQEPSSRFKRGLTPKEPLPLLKRVPPAPIAHATMIGKKRTKFQPQGLPWLLRVGPARPVSSLRHVDKVPKRGARAPWLSHALPAAFVLAAVIGRKRAKNPQYGLRHVATFTKGSRSPWISTAIPAAFAQTAAISKRRMRFQPQGDSWLRRVGPAPSISTLRHVDQEPSSRFKRGEAPKEPQPWMMRVLPAHIARATMVGKKRTRFQPEGLPWLLRVGPAPPISSLRHVDQVPKRGSRAAWLSSALPAAFAQTVAIGKIRRKNPVYLLRHVPTPSTKGSRSPWLATTLPAPFAQTAAISKRRMRFQPQGDSWLRRVGPAPATAISTLRHVDQVPSSAFKRGLVPPEPKPWMMRVLPAHIARAAMVGRKRTKFQPEGLPWLLRVGIAPRISSLRHVEKVPKRGVRAPWLSHALPAAFVQAALVGKKRAKNPSFGLRHVPTPSTRGSRSPWISTTIAAPFAQAAAISKRRMRFQPQGDPWLRRVGPAPHISKLRHVTQEPSSRFQRGEAPKEPKPWMMRVLPAHIARATMIGRKNMKFQPQGLPWLLRVGPAPAISTLRHVERVPKRGVRAAWLSHALPAAFAQAALIGKKRMNNPQYGLRHVPTPSTRGSRSPWIATTIPAPFAQAAAIAKRRMKFQPQGDSWLRRIGPAPPISTLKLRHVDQAPSSAFKRGLVPPEPKPWVMRVLPAPIAHARMAARKRTKFQPQGLPWLLRAGPARPISSLRHVEQVPKRGVRAPWLSSALPAAFAQAAAIGKQRTKNPHYRLRHVPTPSVKGSRSPWVSTTLLAPFVQTAAIARRRMKFQPQGDPWLRRVGPAPPISKLRHVTQEPTSRFQRGEAPKEPLPWMKRVLPAHIARATMIAKKSDKFRPQGLPWLRRVGPAPAISTLKHVERVPKRGVRAPWLSSALPAAFAQTAAIGKKRMKDPHYGLRHITPPTSTKGSRSPWLASTLPAPFAQAAAIGKRRMQAQARGQRWLGKRSRGVEGPWLSTAVPAPFAQAAMIGKRRMVRFGEEHNTADEATEAAFMSMQRRFSVDSGAAMKYQPLPAQYAAIPYRRMSIATPSQTSGNASVLRRDQMARAAAVPTAAAAAAATFTPSAAGALPKSAEPSTVGPTPLPAVYEAVPSSAVPTSYKGKEPLEAQPTTIPTSQPSTSTSATTTPSDIYDVIVIGGGLSGLTAAYKLMTDSNAPKPKVLLLEASDRLGGRIMGVRVPDGILPAGLSPVPVTLEVGAQWIKPTQTKLLRLLEELGLGTYQQHTNGSKLLKRRKKFKSFTSGAPYDPLVAGVSSFNLHRMLSNIKNLALKISPKMPFQYRDAVHLDNMSVAQWVKHHAWNSKSAEALDMAVEWLFGCNSRDVSMLFFLQFIAGSEKDPVKLIGSHTMGNERPLGVIGGAHRIIDELHARFVSLGGVVHTGAVVRSINDGSVSRGDTAESTVATEEGLVEVITSKGSFRGNHLIFAAPPTALKSIQFNPPLPAEKELLGRGSVMGSCIKAFAVYREPFWRKKLQSGEAYVATGNSPLDAVSYTFDASDPIQYPGLFILGAAITGARAQHWSQRSLPERQAAVLNSLKEFFGPQAAQPLYYLDCDWGLNPYTLGGPFAVLPPKVLQATFGILRLPIHRIHWAGAESSTQWYGTMEGAVDAGMVAAFEVNARVNAFKLLKQTLAQQHLAQTTGAAPVSAIPVLVGPQTGADPEKKAAVAPPSPLNIPKNAGTTGSAPTPSPSTMKTRAR